MWLPAFFSFREERPTIFRMIRIRTYLVVFSIIALMAACNTQRQICPAYQSAFVHDSTARVRMFSYFGEDSLPKVMEANKDRHLLIDPVTLRKKRRMMQTVAMVDVYEYEDAELDSSDFDEDLLLAEQDVRSKDLYNEEDLLREMEPAEESEEVESESQDSVYMISLKKEKFNIDQELYLWYLRKFLVYPDVKITMEDAPKPEKQGFFKRMFNKDMTDENGEKVGLFRRLFPKKKKKDKEEEDEGADVTNLTEDGAENNQDDKKGFSLFKKKKKKDKDAEAEDEPPVDEEEDTDDDF